jgi:hypothetical protein
MVLPSGLGEPQAAHASSSVVLCSVQEGQDHILTVLEWCHSGVTVVLQWCHSGVTVMLKWCYSGVTVVLSTRLQLRGVV